MLTVKKIILNYLTDNDYDGLIYDYGDCTCITKNLMPCESSDISMCAPAYIVPSNKLTPGHISMMNEMGFNYILSTKKYKDE